MVATVCTAGAADGDGCRRNTDRRPPAPCDGACADRRTGGDATAIRAGAGDSMRGEHGPEMVDGGGELQCRRAVPPAEDLPVEERGPAELLSDMGGGSHSRMAFGRDSRCGDCFARSGEDASHVPPPVSGSTAVLRCRSGERTCGGREPVGGERDNSPADASRGDNSPPDNRGVRVKEGRRQRTSGEADGDWTVVAVVAVVNVTPAGSRFEAAPAVAPAGGAADCVARGG